MPQRRKQRTAKERDTKGTRKTKATALRKETPVVEEESDEDDSFVPEGSHSEPEDSDGEELEAEDNDEVRKISKLSHNLTCSTDHCEVRARGEEGEGEGQGEGQGEQDEGQGEGQSSWKGWSQQGCPWGRR